MKIIQIILALVVMGISVYGLITKDFSYGPLSSLLLGVFIATIGIDGFKTKGKNSWAMFFMPVSLIIIMMLFLVSNYI